MNKSFNYIDIHTHTYRRSDNIIALYNIFAQDLHNFKHKEDQKYSIGIHPWHISQIELSQAYQLLQKHISNKNVLALGEIGLDINLETTMNIQEEVFKHQLHLAKEIKKPIILHCVGAIDKVLSIKKKENFRNSMVFHGYNKKNYDISKLTKSGIYISFGKSILLKDAPSIFALKEVGKDSLLFETDDYKGNIEEIYQRASEILGIHLDALKEIVFQNYCECFNIEDY